MTVLVPTPAVDRAVQAPACAQVLAEWAWLRDDDRQDPAVLAHLAAENAATDQALAPLARLRAELRAEFGRVQQLDHTGPRMPDGEWEYWTHLPAGADYAQTWRAHRGGEPELILDPQVLAGGAQFALGDVDVSDDHAVLAWTEDRTGDETYRLVVRRIADSQELFALDGSVAGPLGGGVILDPEGNHAWVTALDDACRVHAVVRVDLRTGSQQVVLAEPDERFWVGIHGTSDLACVAIVVGSTSTSEVWLADRTDPSAPARVVAAREPGVRYTVDRMAGHPLAGDDGLLATVAVDCGERYLAAVRTGLPASAWPTAWEPPAGVILESVTARPCHAVMDVRVGGWSRVGVLHVHDGTHAWELVDTGAEGAVTVSSLELAEPEHPQLWVEVDGFAQAGVVLARPLCGGEFTVVHTDEVPPGIDMDAYASGFFTVASHDGVQVPVSWFRRPDRPVTGVLLYGYGAYGLADDPGFVASWAALADRGIVCAVAHVRGGCEFGEAWHRDGRLESKANSFHDYLACARAVADRFGTDKVVARGGSAGGLLVGASVNLDPSAFAGVVAEVPFVDCLATMNDPSLPLVVADYEEWGDPSDPEVAARIGSYAPVENVQAAAYPPVLATCGLHDPRVSYWEPAKWVQVLRARSTATGPFLLRTADHGHAGASGMGDRLDEQAEAAAFVVGVLDGTFASR